MCFIRNASRRRLSYIHGLTMVAIDRTSQAPVIKANNNHCQNNMKGKAVDKDSREMLWQVCQIGKS